jgi:hypothetical protein
VYVANWHTSGASGARYDVWYTRFPGALVVTGLFAQSVCRDVSFIVKVEPLISMTRLLGMALRD